MPDRGEIFEKKVPQHARDDTTCEGRYGTPLSIPLFFSITDASRLGKSSDGLLTGERGCDPSGEVTLQLRLGDPTLHACMRGGLSAHHSLH